MGSSTSAVQQKRKNVLLSNKEIRSKFNSFKGALKLFMLFGWVTALFSPIIFFSWAIYIAIRYYYDVFDVLYSKKKNEDLYKARFSPKGTREHFTAVGYRIDEADIDTHLSIFKHEDAAERLRNLEKVYLKDPDTKRKSQVVGFDIDILTRHFILLGKTGSGKTVTVLSFLNDILEKGGGYVIIDGKSDTKMWSTMYALARKHKRETSMYTVNLLKPETRPDTNTINETQKMHPVKAVEFLTSLITPDSMEGNAQHFLNRGKAMLAPLFSGLRLREIYYNEPFSNTTLAKSSDVPEMNVMFILYYCMIKDITNKIEKNKTLSKYIREGKRYKVADIKEFESYEAILEYVGQNPSKKKEVEEKLGLKYQFFEEAYSNTFKLLRSYIGSVYDKWLTVLEPAAISVYNYQLTNNMNFSYTEISPQTPNNIRDILQQFKKNVAKALEVTKDEESFSPDIIKKAFSGEEGSIDNIPDNAMQQHSYAVQQWTALFLIFNTFSHVMGTPNPEVSMEYVIRNNQQLYVLLPALEQSEEQSAILGKIFLMGIREASAKALGGEKMNITTTQRNIFIDKLKPKPIFMVIADEYGSYAVPGGVLATMTQQLRSLNVSIVISIQDKVSLKASGNDEAGQLKALANSSKIALQLVDDETIDYLKSVILEEEKLDEEYSRTPLGEIVRNGTIKIEKELMFDPKKTQSFQKGMAVLIMDGEPIVFQSFYRAEIEANTFIVRRKKIA